MPHHTLEYLRLSMGRQTPPGCEAIATPIQTPCVSMVLSPRPVPRGRGVISNDLHPLLGPG
ncbi:hypothetical protein M378DRAFT_161428 [Amanita muscaria Koide BX008]|uniref:Uncharacterized protein n=1 Tax=Amanita muscaria (strain Koide BX008) TaxID=946122 RepID=A0A0C2WWG8_AMAMK|nr:hypothetical protein M378DRAFT_161428 [Amanita muscaria Koide BX008]